MSRKDVFNLRGATVEVSLSGTTNHYDVCCHCLQDDRVVDKTMMWLGGYFVDYGDDGKDSMLEECVMVCDICGKVF